MNYQNPLWNHYFADPFVLRHRGMYYAYGTGALATERDGKAFPVLRSSDLVHWEYVGGALACLPGATANWAPEVAEHEGRFYLYYSAALTADDSGHRVRVAQADSPEGPFIDSGRTLLGDDEFSIDPHPFRDPQTGAWYLFFATDYLHEEPFGTGIAVVKLKDMITADVPSVAVNRATQSWQVYEHNRDYKKKIWKAWYTVEGPSVVFHHGRYWCFYSGGRWDGQRYGVGFAVADHPLGPWRDDSAVHGAMVLGSSPGKVLGPGHNSVTLAPDGKTHMLVYHAWDAALTARRMCMDPLIWTPQGPRCDGPSTDPRELSFA